MGRFKFWRIKPNKKFNLSFNFDNNRDSDNLFVFYVKYIGNKKMKIAITTDAIYPFTLGGSEIRNHEVAKRLVKKGHEVHIYGAKLWKGKNIIKKDVFFNKHY